MALPTALYMFALQPPAQLATQIQAMRLRFSEKYEAYEALKPPVHVTMYDPIEILLQEAAAFEKSIARLQRWADQYKPLDIELSNFDYFHDASGKSKMKPVVYIDVKADAVIKKLHKEFLKELKQYRWLEQRKKTYKPHITIGYRDTDPLRFSEMKEDYSNQSFEASFTCSELHLWKHTRGKWQTINSFQFANRPAQLSLF